MAGRFPPGSRSPLPQPQPQRPFNGATFDVNGSGQHTSNASGLYETQTTGNRTTYRMAASGSTTQYQAGGGGAPPQPPWQGPVAGNDDDGPGDGGSDSDGLAPGTKRSDLVDFMTSHLIKVTIVAQPDLKGLLTHQALRKLIRDIALAASHIATMEALARLEQEQKKLQQEMEKWMEKSMIENISKTMEAELSPLAQNSAAYSLGDLTRMKAPQITAYNAFAPKIGAPAIETPHVSSYQGEEDEVD